MQLRNKGIYLQEINDNTLRASSAEDELIRVREKEKDLDNMKEALDMLNDDQRICVTLFYLEKKSYQAVADETGFNLQQVKSYIQNGKRNMRINLDRMKKHE